MAERGHRSVPGHESSIIAHGPKPVRDRADQLLLISAREVPPANRALEQDVADQREFQVRMMEDDMAGRVAGAVAHIESEFADGRLIAILEPARRLEGPADDAVARTVLAKLRDPENIVLVRSLDWNAELLGEDARASAMIDMAMCEQDFFDLHTGLLGSRLEPRKVAARIDEGAAHRRRTPQQGAILLQRSDGDDRRSKRGFAHLGCSSVAIEGGSAFIESATASARRMTRSTFPPASLARFSSLQPRRISSANSNG